MTVCGPSSGIFDTGKHLLNGCLCACVRVCYVCACQVHACVRDLRCKVANESVYCVVFLLDLQGTFIVCACAIKPATGPAWGAMGQGFSIELFCRPAKMDVHTV